MANRDVDLIIRAKNQASKNLDAVSQALDALKAAQGGVATSADKTGAAISALGGELDQLKARSQAFEQFEKAKAVLDTSANAVKRLEGDLASGRAKLDSYGQQAAKVAAEIEQMGAALAELRAKEAKQKEDLAASRQAVLKKSDAVKELARAEKAYAASQKLASDAPERDTKIAEAKARLEAATSAVQRNKAAFAEQQKIVAQTGIEIKNLSGQIRDLKIKQRELSRETDAANYSIETHVADLERAKTEHAQMEARINETAAALSAFSIEAQQSSGQVGKLTSEIERLGALMQSIMRYSTGAGQFVDPKQAAQMQSLRGSVANATAAQQALQAEAAQLSAAMRASGGGTAEQTARFRDLIGAARAAKEEAASLSRQMAELQLRSRPVAPMFANLEGATKRLAAAQRELAAAQARVAARGGVNPANQAGLFSAIAAQNAKTVSALSGVVPVVPKAGGTKDWKSFLEGINRESRQAMSIYQRLRGEVLALAVAYGGLYGAISGVGQVISAYRTLEAAQNRLGVVFDQNQSKVNTEMLWLQSQAARLGIEFGALSNQYSKFAVSARESGFSVAQTRDVFMALAEAGRVNKLSLDDMNGVFLAVTQMIQKGKVSAEELRGQLGERLPAALEIFSAGLGVSSGELMKMMEAGEVLANSTTMLGFADKLNEKFGPQLQKSLASTTTKIGQFQNNLFNAQLGVAKGGFLEAFDRMLAKINEWFESRAGRDYFLSLGAALGKMTDAVISLMDYLPWLKDTLIAYGQIELAIFAAEQVANIRTFAVALMETSVGMNATSAATAMTAKQMGTFSGMTNAAMVSNSAFLASLKAGVANVIAYGQQIIASTARLGSMVAATNMASVSTQAFSLRLLAARAAALVATGVIGVMRAGVLALNVALTAMGGPIGAIIMLGTVLGTSLLLDWATQVDDATTALDEHERIMTAVLGQYDKLKDKTDGWAESIKGVTLDQANSALIKMMQKFDEERQAAADAATGVGGGSFQGAILGGSKGGVMWSREAQQIKNLGAALSDGRIKIDAYVKELEKLYAIAMKNGNESLVTFIGGLLDSARAAQETANKAGPLAEVAKKMGSTLSIVSDALGVTETKLEDVANGSDETTRAMRDGTAAADDYAESVGKIKGFIPELRQEMELLKKTIDLNKAAWDAMTAAMQSGDFAKQLEIMNLWNRARLSILQEAEASRVNDIIEGGVVGRIIGVESGGNASAQNPNSSATGLGQFIESTWLSLFKKYFHEASGMSDAAILELRKNAEYSRQMTALYLQENAKALQSAGMAVTDTNLYLAHFLGAGGAKAVIGADPNTPVSSILGADQIAANQSILGGKTAGEVIAWADKKMGSGRPIAEVERELAVLEQIAQQRQAATEEMQRQREATARALSDMGFENEMLQMKAAGKEKEAFIEEQIRNLREQNKNLTAEEEARARDLLSKQYELNAAIEKQKDKKSEIEEIEKRIAALQSQKSGLQEQRDIYFEDGNSAKVLEIDAQISGVNKQLLEAIDNAKAMYKAMGGPEADAAIAGYDALTLSIGRVKDKTKEVAYTQQEFEAQLKDMISGGFVNAFTSFAEAIANGEDAIKSIGDAFQQFAADFLLKIGQMIIEQITLNLAMQAAKAITGLFGGIMVFPAFHTGGIVGVSAGSGNIAASPAWFNNAMRYHSGGIAGLKPNEVPAILQAGEEVLTANDPRHSRNAGKGQSGGSTRIINTFDAASFLSEALKNVVGEETILNYVRANPAAFKQAMGG